MTPEQELAELRAELKQTSARLQRVEAAQQTVRADHESTGRELRELVRAAGEDLNARNDDDRKRLRDEVRADVAELRAQVDHLARAMRRMDGAPVVDLDPDSALVVLAQRVEQGLRLSAGRLDDAAREANVASVRAWEARELDAERHRGTALDAGAEVAARAPGRPRRAAEGRFRAATHALAELAAGRDEVRAAAEVARRRLDDDDEWLRRHGPDITAGRDARAELGDRYRQRIDAMIAGDGLPPGWFTTALGQPSGDAEAWRATAVDVLVYRAVFAVIDPVAALGRAPDDDASPQRRGWYADLAARLSREPA